MMKMTNSLAKQTLRNLFESISRHFQAGEMMEANRKIEHVLADFPDNINFLHLGGLIKQNIGEFDLAEKLLSTAYALRPDHPEIMHNLAVFFLSRGKLDQAVGLYEQLVKLVPTQPPIWVNYGHALRQQGKLNAALKAFEEAQKLGAEKFDIEAVIALTRRQLALWDNKELAPEKVSAALAPIFIADPFQHLEITRKAAAQIKPVAQYEAQAVPNQSRVRIGYLSNDLHDHATSYLIAELFALHDREKFEVFVYSYGVEDQSLIRTRLKQTAEHWVECRERNSAYIADRIFRDRINILVDLKGYTRGGHPEVLAARPANINVQWLGYPGSMGAEFIDYIVADATLVPPELRKAYSEKLVSMPHSYQLNDRQRKVASPKNRADYDLPEDALVLASFCQTYKITPDVFGIWMRVLKNTSKAMLWLFVAHEEAIDNLKANAQSHGVDPSRLVFAKRAAQEQHLARYAHVDLALDTAPYGGHTTTSDALWGGAPVVSLMGQSFASRVSSSILRAANLPELVTDNLEAYEAKIKELVNNPTQLQAYKKRLNEQRLSLPLFDSQGFVRALENAYGQIWQSVQNKQELKDIAL